MSLASLFGVAAGEATGTVIKESLDGVGGLLKDVRHVITGKDPDLDAKLAEIDAKLGQAQNEVNKIEAAHPSVFVSGWRPFIGWVCGFGIGYQMVFRPILGCILVYWNFNLPSLDISSLVALVTAMLGLAGSRSFEKTKRVSRS